MRCRGQARVHLLPVGFRSYIAYCVLKQNGWNDVAFLSGGTMTYHGYHRTPLTVGQGGMPMVAHAEDELAQRAPAPSNTSDEPREIAGRRHGRGPWPWSIDILTASRKLSPGSTGTAPQR